MAGAGKTLQEAGDWLLERSLAAAHNGVLIADALAPDCPLIFANAAAAAITGYAQEELLGRSCRFLFRPDDDGEGAREVHAALTGRRPCRVTFTSRRKDGSTYWNDLQITPVADADGAVTHFIGVMSDVSEREEMLAVLRSRNQELDALARLGQAFLEGETLDTMRPRIVALAHEFTGVERLLLAERDGDGLRVTAGLGWPAGVVGTQRLPVVPGSLVARGLAASGPLQLRDLRHDSSVGLPPLPEAELLVSTLVLPVRSRGNVHGVLAGFTSVERWFGVDQIAFLQSLANTVALAIERDAAEARTRRLQRELLRVTRDSALVDFGATIAHELNQPIAAVMNYAHATESLLGAQEVSGTVREYLQRTAESADRAGEILRRLRQLVATGAVAREPFDLNEAVRDGARLALLHVDHRAQVVYECAPGLLLALGDALQVQQVVFNLVRNALQAMDGQPAARLRLATSRRGGDALEVQVEDHGPGVDPAILDDAADRYTSLKPGGMGIGLSICRSIVGAHGGRLWVTPTAGGGATVHFTVPVATT